MSDSAKVDLKSRGINSRIMCIFDKVKTFLLYESIFSAPNIVWVFLAIDVLTRFFWIGRESIWLDEANSINTMQRIPAFEHLVDTYAFSTQWNSPHSIFYYLLLRVYLFFLGINGTVPSEVVLRSLSAIFGILILPLTYYAGRLIDKDVGILASLLILMNSSNLYYSQMGRMYTLDSFLIIMSSYLFYILLSREDTSYRQYIYYISISSILIYTDYIGLLVLGTHFLYGLFYYLITADRIRIKRVMISFICIFLLYLPWMPAFIQKFRENGTGWMVAPTIIQALGALACVIGAKLPDLPFSSSIGKFIFGVLVFGILVLFLVIGFIISFKDKKKINSLMAAICMIPLAMFFISFISVPIFNERQISSFAPEIDLILATGLMRSSSLFPGFNYSVLDRIILVSILFSTVLMIGNIYLYYTVDTYEDWRGTAKYIDENIREGDGILFDAYYIKKPFGFYSKSKDVYLEIDRSSELIDPLENISEYKIVWVILSHTKHNKDDYIRWLNGTKIKYEMSLKHFRSIDILRCNITN